MNPLPGTAEIFAGALMSFALEAAGTSDKVTKPAANNAAWLSIDGVEKYQHKPITTKEDVDVPDEDLGWRSEIRVYTTADTFEITMRNATSIYHQLQFGLASAITIGTAQTPAVKADRKVRGWVKIQLRQHVGTDRYIVDDFCEVRLMGDPPEAGKATQKHGLQLFVVKSTLNAFNQVT